MAPLIKTNKYLKDKMKYEEMIEKSTFESSVFEGASPRSLRIENYSEEEIKALIEFEKKQDKL